MTDHLENQILNVLALKSSKPVRQLDTLQNVCEILSADTRYYANLSVDLMGDKALPGIVYRN